MARKKSRLRSLLNMRQLRWQGTRALATALPGLRARLAFPVHAVRAVEAAAQVFEDSAEPVALPHSETEGRDILAPSAFNDTGDTRGTSAGQGTLWRQAALIEGCDILGHTRTLLRRSDSALVNFDAAVPNRNFAKPARLQPRALTPGRYGLFSSTSNYFHFLANDVLPLISRLDRFARREPLTIVVPAGGHAVQKGVCDALARAYPQLSFVEIGADERLTGGSIEWVFALCADYEWMPVTRDLADRLTAILRDASPAPGDDYPARVFLDRGDAKLRRMTDDAAVRAVMERHGFRPFVAHHGNHRAQVETFHRAEALVAVHGAGLTNLLFCRPGTKVVEIFPANFVKSTYFWLSRRLGLDYHYLVGGPGDYDQAFEAGAAGLDTLLHDALRPQ